MKVGTLNIDWLLKSESTKKRILEKINQQNFDFLIVTENIENFSFSNDYYVYHSNKIPLDSIYENLDYGNYLKGKQAIRTSIYSKHKSIRKNEVQDAFTSVCHTFLVNGKKTTIYGTIIGTWGILHQKTLAKKELLNFIKDSETFVQYENMIVAGDLNTSFIISENREMTQINSRAVFEMQMKRINCNIATSSISQNIDHILLSNSLNYFDIEVFISEDELNDKFHKGISLEVD